MADTGIGDPGGGALATVDTTAVDTTPSTSSESTGTESTALATTTDSQVETTQQAPVTISSALAPIKTAHPQVYKKIHAAVGGMQRLQSEFPGQEPFKALSTLKQMGKQVQKLGGIELISQQIAEMEQLDLFYSDGDPRMLQHMTRTPEGKADFVKLAPHAFSLYQKLAPNGFSSYIARTMLDDIIGQRVDMIFARLAESIPQENTIAHGELAKFSAYIKRLQDYEKLPPEQLTPAIDPRQEELDRKQADIEKKEKDMEISGWKASANAEKARIIAAAWDRATKGLKISPEERQDILTLVRTDVVGYGGTLGGTIGRIPGFLENTSAFIESGDRDGYLRYLQGVHQEHFPKAIEKQVRKRYPTARGAAPAISGTVQTAARPAAEPGWKMLPKAPAAHELRHDPGMVMFKQNKGIMRDGTKVQWP